MVETEKLDADLVENFEKPNSENYIFLGGGLLFADIMTGAFLGLGGIFIPVLCSAPVVLTYGVYLFSRFSKKRRFLNKVINTLDVGQKPHYKELTTSIKNAEILYTNNGELRINGDLDASRVEDNTYLINDVGLWKIVPSDSKEIWDTNLSALKDLYSIQDSSPVLA